MSDATFFGPVSATHSHEGASDLPHPAPPPVAPPVLIGDAVTPLGDRTLLSLLMCPADPDQPPDR